jgi:hypothetical protein
MCQVSDFVPGVAIDALKRPLAERLADRLGCEANFLEHP